MKKIFLLILIITLYGCDRTKKESHESLPPMDTPPSYLSFRVNFPVTEIERGVNRILPMELFDDAVAMKDRGDTLYLTVKRKGRLSMSYKDGEIQASIPLDISAAIKKSFLGITFSNRDRPVEFFGTLRAAARIGLTDDWNLSVSCTYEDFELGDQASFSVMGMTFNAEKTINSALENHRDELSNIICRALNEGIDFRQVMEKVWLDLQKPLRIAQTPQTLWLYSQPLGLNGELIPANDTLAIHLGYRTAIQIRTEDTKGTSTPLTRRKPPLNNDNQLVLYPDVRVPYRDLSSILEATFKNQMFEYEGYRVMIEKVKVGHEGQRLTVDLDVSGDINGLVKVSGVPILSADRTLSLSAFEYEIDADDDLLKMADMMGHSFVEEYLSDQVRVDTKPFFDDLDELIIKGLAKTPLNDKIGVALKLTDISTYQTRLTEDYIQWIFSVEGNAAIHLKNGLFQSK